MDNAMPSSSTVVKMDESQERPDEKGHGAEVMATLASRAALRASCRKMGSAWSFVSLKRSVVSYRAASPLNAKPAVCVLLTLLMRYPGM